MKKLNFTKRTLLIIALIAVFAAAIFINRHPKIMLESIRLFNSDYDTPSITFERSDCYGFEKGEKNIVAAYTDSVKAYDSSLNEKWSILTSGDNPEVKTGGKNTLVYYGAEKRASVRINDKNIFITTDYPILNGFINESGYFALVTEEKGFKSQIIVYDEKGNEIYKWHSADCYVTGAVISDDCKTMAANTVFYDESGISSKVMMFSFTESKPFSEIVKNDTLILDVKFIGRKKLLITGDLKTGVYNTDGTNLWEEDYSDKQLFTYNCDDDNIILAVGNTASSTEKVSVKIFSHSGKLKGEYVHNGEVIGIDTADGKILVYGKRNLVLISDGGREKNNIDLNLDIRTAFLFDDGKTVFAVSNSVGKIYYLR